MQEALDAGERMAGRIKATSAGCKAYLHPLKFKVSVSRCINPNCRPHHTVFFTIKSHPKKLDSVACGHHNSGTSSKNL